MLHFWDEMFGLGVQPPTQYCAILEKNFSFFCQNFVPEVFRWIFANVRCLDIFLNCSGYLCSSHPLTQFLFSIVHIVVKWSESDTYSPSVISHQLQHWCGLCRTPLLWKIVTVLNLIHLQIIFLLWINKHLDSLLPFRALSISGIFLLRALENCFNQDKIYMRFSW